MSNTLAQIHNLWPHVAIRFMCPDCQGEGSIGGRECDYCYGNGEQFKYIPLKDFKELLRIQDEESW